MKNILVLFTSILFITQTQAQWQKQVSNTEASFRSVCAVSDKIVWVGGSKGTFVKTTDGGATWTATQVQGAETLDFRDVHAFDSQTAILVSAGEAEKGNAKIYRTEDGGKTWQIVYQTTQKGVFFDGIDFWDAQNGIIFSDPIDGKFVILKTKDGGKSWNPISPANIPENQKGEAAFAASGTSLVTFGKNQAYICTGGGESARVFYSENQGENWSVMKTNMPASQASGLFGLRFWDKQHGIAVGGDYQEVNKAIPNVLLTSDGGKTWQDAPQTNPAGLKEGVSVYKKKVLIAVGPSGTCYSKDFGKSWIMIDKTAFHAISISGDGVWAVGGKGVISKLSLEVLK
ncbi:MAG: oxidoreductase [Arcicella sp.]|nr:oxidoreductase [Arcicella sp.]